MPSFTILIFIGILLVDSLLSDVSSIINRNLTEQIRIGLFSAIAAIAIFFGSRAILYNSKKVKAGFTSKNNVLFLISDIIPIIQYIIIGLLILITVQINFTYKYFTILLIASLAMSWITGVVLMAILSFKFAQWYRAKRNLLVLLYLLSSLMFCVTLGSTIIPQILITIQKSPFLVNSHSTEIKPFQANPEKLDILFSIISVANWFIIPLSFIVWIATAIMLNSYSRKFGRIKYWIMLAAALASVIVGDVSLLAFLPSVNTVFDQQVIFYTMMAFGGMLAEGFLLGFAFVVISKNIKNRLQSKLIDYLGISASGVAILFVSFFANPSAGSYLPFGVISASFFSFGAYLFFAGIYSSSISIASDAVLRQTIRKSLLDHSKLLDNIGLADIHRDLEKHTNHIWMKHIKTMKDETGIEPSTSESEMKNYVNEVISELQKTKERNSSSKDN